MKENNTPIKKPSLEEFLEGIHDVQQKPFAHYIEKDDMVYVLSEMNTCVFEQRLSYYIDIIVPMADHSCAVGLIIHQPKCFFKQHNIESLWKDGLTVENVLASMHSTGIKMLFGQERFHSVIHDFLDLHGDLQITHLNI